MRKKSSTAAFSRKPTRARVTPSAIHANTSQRVVRQSSAEEQSKQTRILPVPSPDRGGDKLSTSSVVSFQRETICVRVPRRRIRPSILSPGCAAAQSRMKGVSQFPSWSALDNQRHKEFRVLLHLLGITSLSLSGVSRSVSRWVGRGRVGLAGGSTRSAHNMRHPRLLAWCLGSHWPMRLLFSMVWWLPRTLQRG